ncbi:MAG: hypothetical protein GY906_36845, partial [bacterium]|nr:hypothetical protein [bacterium]
MNPYLMFAIVAVPTTILVMLGAYLWFRKGLGARIFNFFCPLLAFSVGVGWCAALEPTWTRLLIAAAVEVAVAVPALIMFFKTVVTRLENQTGAMASSISQIAATASEQAATATEQASTVAQVGTTVDEISQTSSAALSSAQKVLSVATEAADKGRKGVQAVADTLRVMERIGEVVE